MHISSYITSDLFLFRNEETLVELLVYSSFGQVATNMLRNVSVITGGGTRVKQPVLKWGLNIDSLRNQHGTTAKLSGWNDCDVTGLVATEHVRNEYALRDSITLYFSDATESWVSVITLLEPTIFAVSQIKYIPKLDLHWIKQNMYYKYSTFQLRKLCDYLNVQ